MMRAQRLIVSLFDIDECLSANQTARIFKPNIAKLTSPHQILSSNPFNEVLRHLTTQLLVL